MSSVRVLLPSSVAVTVMFVELSDSAKLESNTVRVMSVGAPSSSVMVVVTADGVPGVGLGPPHPDRPLSVKV